jgi:GT2 family glycosyltransferase
MNFDDVGIVVLTHGSGGEQEPLLETLLGEGAAGSIVVVHNPTGPGEAPPEVPPGCELVQAEKNLGYAAGMNLGIARLRERGVALLLLLTHDVRLPDGTLADLFGAAAREPGYGVLAPALRVSGTGEVFSFGGVSHRNGATEHLKARPPAPAAGLAACDWVDGGLILIRAEVLDRVGTYDERFWGYCEEADLCLRARRAGWRVGVLVDAFAEQAPGGGGRLGVWSYLMTRNGTEYVRRAAGTPAMLVAVARNAGLVAFNLARVPLRLVRRRPGGPREPWLLAVGTAWGTIDFARRRWGPPPPSLPGMGDVKNL